jgi:alkylation response protein AidB-like acyl-CoA dehydrogenase
MLRAKAADIAPILNAEVATNEALGRLSDPAMAALRSGDFFAMFAPLCYGGFETGPVEGLEVIEALCTADGSAGWVVMAAGLCIAAAGAFLDDAGADAVFRNGRTPVIAGHGGPNGKAVVEGKGFRLSGQWQYGSGIQNADFIHSGAVIYENGAPRLTASGHPEIRIFVTPRSDAVLAGNWDVLGLRATGSVDYTMTDLYVGEEFSHLQSAQDPKRGGKNYTIGLLGFAVIGHTGFALGVGRRALDEVAKYARGRSGPTGALGASDSFKEGYGTAEAQFRAARALVYETWRDIEATINAGERMSTRQITLARLAMNHVTNMAAEAATFAYRIAGGTSLRDSALQRCFRDIHAGTQHLHASPIILRECGRELAGLAEGEIWGRFGLSAGGGALR